MYLIQTAEFKPRNSNAGELGGPLVDCALPRNSDIHLSRQLTYRDAGVDIDAGDELIRRIGPAAQRTKRPEMIAGIGGFAALAALPSRYREPVLVTGTDGVGTKLKLAIDHDRHDGVGQDLVAMCVNDVLVTGGEPFLFLDYYATSRLDVDVAERVIKGIARACELAGCALAGGETAEMPGFYGKGDYDLAGFCVGVVERDQIIDGRSIAPGHRLIGLTSSGPHSNGYSLIRRIIADQAQMPDRRTAGIVARAHAHLRAFDPRGARDDADRRYGAHHRRRHHRKSAAHVQPTTRSRR